MRDVQATSLPPCDLCGSQGCGVYNAPTRLGGPFGGKWGNFCEPCFPKVGLDTSVTERRVLPRLEAPDEVKAIARHWGGERSDPVRLADGQWRFAEIMEDYGDAEGFVYVVYEPGAEHPFYEDSGRPEGHAASGDWVVRCVNDAPDALWTVSADGTYRGFRGEEKIW